MYKAHGFQIKKYGKSIFQNAALKSNFISLKVPYSVVWRSTALKLHFNANISFSKQLLRYTIRSLNPTLR